MRVTSLQTHKITLQDRDIFAILERYILQVKENSVVAITSKIIAICQGRVASVEATDKDALIEQESQYFLPRDKNPYDVSLTISHNILIATAGIDESNANGYYILWPEDPQAVANKIRKYLREKFHLQNIGIIITDSRT